MAGQRQQEEHQNSESYGEAKQYVGRNERTAVVSTRPDCTAIRSPLDGTSNVNVASNITWDYASSATGYRVSIGTTTGGIDVLNNEDVGNILTYNPPTDLAFNTEFFIRITR